jgi:tetratricopeptide (TPR) repeat protein
MAALLSLTSRMLADPHGTDLEHGLDVIALARLFEDLNRWEDAALLYERGLKTAHSTGSPAQAGQTLPEADFWQAVRRLSVLQKRRGDIETALRLWEQAAAEGHIYAHVELAKYYEHTRKDHAAAMQWTLSAMAHVAADLSMPAYMKQHWIEELEHRQKRLEGKVKK